MAVHRCGSLLRYAALLLVLCAAVGGQGRFKGFRSSGSSGSFTGGRDTGEGTGSEEQWFTQRLDHFNGADSREWKQRYFVNEAFSRPGGPVFLMIGGEGPTNPAWMHNGTWLTYAQKLGALCLMLEHRFYGKSHPTACGARGTNITIKLLCGVMADASLGDPYARYAAVKFKVRTFHRSSDPASCGRQWVYQTCTEFGFYQSTDSPNQPFTGFPLEYHVKQCSDFFNISGDELLAAVSQTNEFYGGFSLVSSRIVLPNGSVDPWHALGVTRDLGPELPAVFIKGTAHCANMYPASSEDLPQLALARDHIFLLLQRWLKQ
ncbi:Thymus-specific serine protease [Liparis tanakae]|uniref:Thymus-specific serine protease n=1 Tax=Liparis tanakae TaxID=230148 RepID=A0A4Z2FCT4_9TELE|nr:Thymus-specific serine protease [Liparis tanakae]